MFLSYISFLSIVFRGQIILHLEKDEKCIKSVEIALKFNIFAFLFENNYSIDQTEATLLSRPFFKARRLCTRSTTDATVAKTSLKIASSSFSIYFAIMSVCLTFESSRNYPGTEFRGAASTLEKNIQICV